MRGGEEWGRNQCCYGWKAERWIAWIGSINVGGKCAPSHVDYGS